ncbi:unnamed protein product [Lymnaea stagnalis]|uniref:Cadherin domain-containing protein n=1 Tax=Lymnaea stagnalis TaxID=6523 RepID=A0AAV2H8W2_LYMST
MMFQPSVIVVLLMAAVHSDAQRACDSLDNGPFLGTLPTLDLIFDEATAEDIANQSASQKYYSELRIVGDYGGGDFNVTRILDSNFIDPFEYFEIVTAQGKNYMRLVKALDRDGDSASLDDDITLIAFKLTCYPRDGNDSKVYDVRIFINDVNDNTPMFLGDNSTNQINLYEATPISTVVYTATAVDKDSNLENNLTYSLLSHTDKFTIDRLTGQVTLKQDLDFESADKFYDLLIQVQDGGPGTFRTSTTVVYLTVKDSDDQGPAFTYPGCFTYDGVCAWPKYTTGRQLRKDAAIQVLPVPNKISSTVTITAYDRDLAIANPIRFSIASTIPPGQENNFRVDTVQGQGRNYTATVTPLLDAEVAEGFEIFLKAEEVSAAQRHVIAMIFFTGPTATPNQATTRAVCEPLDDGPYLGTRPTLNLMFDEATAEDLKDSKKYYSELRVAGNYGSGELNLSRSLDFELIDPFEYFEVVTEEGINYMRLTQALDRDGLTASPDDDVTYIPFTLTCTPKNSSLSSVVYDVRIFIKDVNDNPPMFTDNTTQEVRVQETVAVGTVVYKAVAVDKDSNLEGNLTYSIGNATDKFAVDSLTGDVTVLAALDFESLGAQRFYDLTLKVEDGGPGVKLSASMSLRVYVTDVDDHGPAFTYTGCITHKEVCALPKYTTGLRIKKNEVIKVYPVPNQVNGFVSINAFDQDKAIANEITFSVALTMPAGQENNFRVDTVKGTGNEYTANIVSLVDMEVSEGLEIYLKAEEKSSEMRNEIAVILFTTTAGVTSQQQQATDNNNNNTDSANYSDLEIALIVVVAILATFLVSMMIGVLIYTCARRKSSKESDFSTPM